MVQIASVYNVLAAGKVFFIELKGWAWVKNHFLENVFRYFIIVRTTLTAVSKDGYCGAWRVCDCRICSWFVEPSPWLWMDTFCTVTSCFGSLGSRSCDWADGELRGEGGRINQWALPFTCGRGGPAFGKQCSTKELCTSSDPPSQKGTGVIMMTFNKISPCIHDLQDMQAIFSYHFKMEGIWISLVGKTA